MIQTCLDDISPSDLGLPPKFQSYRPAQREGVDWSVLGDPNTSGGKRRFMCAGMPPGVGKLALAHTIGLMNGGKYAILTATKSLEDQNVRDGFADTADPSFDCVNVRGKANYDCIVLDPKDPERKHKCSDGEDRDCPWVGQPRCTYGGRVKDAKDAGAIITNYAYWLHARGNNRGALESGSDPITTLICDEAHLAFGALSSFLSTWVSLDTFTRFTGTLGRPLLRQAVSKDWGWVDKKWHELLSFALNAANQRMADLVAQSGGKVEARRDPEYRKVEKIALDLQRVVTHGLDEGCWIWRPTDRGVAFDCVWPYRYAERYLFQGIENVVLLSATLRPKLMQLLGIPKDQYDFREWPRQFDPRLTPVYYWPAAKMGRAGGDEATGQLVKVIDTIIEARPGVKGLIHTAAYHRAEQIQARSKFGKLMVLNKNSDDAMPAAERHRSKQGASWLVGPSYTTGWDFSDHDCRIVIVAKLPFSDRSNPLTAARKSDKEFENYTVMQTVYQACHRGSRHFEDWSEVFILDAQWRWFRGAGAKHAPQYFTTRQIDRMPPRIKGV